MLSASFFFLFPIRKKLLPAVWTFRGQDQGAELRLDVWNTAELQFSQTILPRDDGGHGGYGDFQKDEGDPIPYEAGGVTHLLSTNAGRPIALWVNGPVEGSIIGDITMDELKQIIDSIYE